jgi:hypothetical protein
MSSRWFCVVSAALSGMVPSAQVRHVARTLTVAVRADRRPGARGHGHIADSVVAADITQSRLRRSDGMWRCRQERTVKPSAQPTLVRTQHLPRKNPRSEPVTPDGVTGFSAQNERLRKPSALFCGLCVGQVRPWPGLGGDRLRCHLTCGNASGRERQRAVVRAGRARRAWAVGGTGDWFAYI